MFKVLSENRYPELGNGKWEIGEMGEKKWGKPVFIHTTSSGYSVAFLNHL
jgi:hypothetical protein